MQYNHLRVFDCVANAQVGYENLEKRILKCLFLGYPNGVDGYTIWCDNSKKYIINRNVTFEEDMMFIQVNFEEFISSPSLAR